jgi:uncharacterized repeat protein (TIGR03943 family)
MTDRISRNIAFFAPAAVMSAWATVMLHTVASGHINRLLSPLFRNYVLIAALLLLALSVLYVLLYQPTVETASALAPRGRLRQFGRWLVLLIPVVAAAILSPDALSKTTMINKGLDPTAGAIAMPSWDDKTKKAAQEAIASDPNQPVGVEVTDLITLSQNPDQVKAFEGRPVRAVGLVVEQPGEAPMLVRWVMWCCAADAIPKSVALSGGKLPANATDTQYYEVIGKATFPSKLGHIVPTIEVDSIAPTTEPDEPYLSP